MLLAIQSTIPKSLLHHHHHHHHHHSVSLSSPLSHSLSFPSGSRSKKHPVIRCSISKLANMFENFVFSLLPQPSKEEALEVIEGLKKFGNYKRALQVCEVMNRKQESFGMTMTTTDAAIQLDLIDKVHGTFAAEDYFLKLPETLKDEQTHIVLLISYANSKMREKAESIHTQMITRGYPMDPLQFYVMMNLYKDLKEYDKVDLLVSEMRQKNIPLDVDCYNVWLSCFVDQGSVEKVEQVFEQMEQDSTVNPDWDSFYLMGLFYIRVGLLEKAEECIKMCESRITGQDRIFYYHNVIRLYGNLGKREEVYRAWNVFKKISPKTSMMGYHTMISSLVRLGDIEGAEQLYAEWLSVMPTNNPRILNLLMSYYTRNGLLVKAEDLLDRMVESGGKPNPGSWEILAEGHIREKKVSEALSCLKEAVLVRGSKNWKPRPVNVSSILSICEQNDDMQSKDVLMGLLSQVGCFEDEAYKSNVPSTGGVATVRNEGEDSYRDEILVNELQGSFQ